jgi:hypothetical protein
MTESVNVQYVGFEAKSLVREYSFIVRRALYETSEFTLTWTTTAALTHEGLRVTLISQRFRGTSSVAAGVALLIRSSSTKIRLSLAHVVLADNGELQPRRLTGNVYR